MSLNCRLLELRLGILSLRAKDLDMSLNWSKMFGLRANDVIPMTRILQLKPIKYKVTNRNILTVELRIKHWSNEKR